MSLHASDFERPRPVLPAHAMTTRPGVSNRGR